MSQWIEIYTHTENNHKNVHNRCNEKKNENNYKLTQMKRCYEHWVQSKSKRPMDGNANVTNCHCNSHFYSILLHKAHSTYNMNCQCSVVYIHSKINNSALTPIDIQFSSAVFGNLTITLDPAFSSLSFSGRKRHTTLMLSSAAISRSADIFNYHTQTLGTRSSKLLFFSLAFFSSFFLLFGWIFRCWCSFFFRVLVVMCVDKMA